MLHSNVALILHFSSFSLFFLDSYDLLGVLITVTAKNLTKCEKMEKNAKFGRLFTGERLRSARCF